MDRNSPRGETFSMQGWAVLGHLESGWNADVQQNYSDMQRKLKQLGLRSLLPQSESQPVLYPDDLFYSQGTFDIVQLLSAPSDGRGIESNRIVAYSIWLSTQGWAGFSPFPLIKFNPGAAPKRYVLSPVDQGFGVLPTHITGWCVLGSFDSKWYSDLQANYDSAYHMRSELGITEATPLYWAQSQDVQCLQVLQAPGRRGSESGAEAITNSYGAMTEYVNWFAQQGFGSLTPQPIMNADMVAEANALAGATP